MVKTKLYKGQSAVSYTWQHPETGKNVPPGASVTFRDKSTFMMYIIACVVDEMSTPTEYISTASYTWTHPETLQVVNEGDHVVFRSHTLASEYESRRIIKKLKLKGGR